MSDCVSFRLLSLQILIAALILFSLRDVTTVTQVTTANALPWRWSHLCGPSHRAALFSTSVVYYYSFSFSFSFSSFLSYVHRILELEASKIIKYQDLMLQMSIDLETHIVAWLIIEMLKAAVC